MVSGGAPGPEAPSFINIRLADELAASGRTSEHAQGAARAGSSFAKASVCVDAIRLSIQRCGQPTGSVTGALSRDRRIGYPGGPRRA